VCVCVCVCVCLCVCFQSLTHPHCLYHPRTPSLCGSKVLQALERLEQYIQRSDEKEPKNGTTIPAKRGRADAVCVRVCDCLFFLRLDFFVSVCVFGSVVFNYLQRAFAHLPYHHPRFSLKALRGCVTIPNDEKRVHVRDVYMCLT
jgi:hypothetical protein